jgi:streptogramin lyase
MGVVYGDPRATLIDERTAELRRRRPEVGLGSVEIAKEPDGVWVAASTAQALVKLDPGSGRRVARVALPTQARSVAVREGAVWVGLAGPTPGAPDTFARVDPQTGQLTGNFPVTARIRSLVATPNGIWVVHRDRPELTRRDAATGAVERRVRVGTTRLGDATYGAGAVWVTSPLEDTLSRIDDRTGAKVSSAVGRRPNGVAARGSQVWVSSFIEHTIQRVDPRTSRLMGRPVAVPLNPYALALTPDSVWLTAVAGGEVARVRMAAPPARGRAG